MDTEEVIKERIMGHDLPTKIGKEIVILGTISRRSSNGQGIELLTTDGVKVNAILNEPLNGNEEGYVEVSGIPQSKGTISCTNYVIFPSDVTHTFQVDQYNKVCSLLYLLENEKEISITDYEL
ncbi:hypothetical protein M0802_008287 [Mischocyttarus mexicanus]|nr:hypothetical protein M0802_008287 [Mischocyttarus mexicanus]